LSRAQGRGDPGQPLSSVRRPTEIANGNTKQPPSLRVSARTSPPAAIEAWSISGCSFCRCLLADDSVYSFLPGHTTEAHSGLAIVSARKVLICRLRPQRTGARVRLFRGRAEAPIGSQAAHQRRGAADRRQYRKAARWCVAALVARSYLLFSTTWKHHGTIRSRYI
jgi:hypothetical protein